MPAVRFNLFGFPVQVLPGYWLLTALLSLSSSTVSAAAAFAMMGILFVSVVVHELGHAFAARKLGMTPQITLHAMGGVTTFAPAADLTRGRDVFVSFSGPLAGFLLAATGWGLLRLTHLLPESNPDSPFALVDALETLVLVNAFWSAVNLVPVIPFDGGRILQAALGPDRRMLAASLSLGVGVVAAAGFAYLGYLFSAVLFGVSAIGSFMRARQAPVAPVVLPVQSAEEACRLAEAALKAEDFPRAELIARALLGSHPNPPERRRALRVLLWSLVGRGDARGARSLVVAAADEVDKYLQAVVHDAAGYPDSARETLTRARSEGDTRPEVTALLIRVLLVERKGAAAANLTHELLDHLTVEEIRRVVDEARTLGAVVEAARLGLELAVKRRSAADAERAAADFDVAGDREGAERARAVQDELKGAAAS